MLKFQDETLQKKRALLSLEHRTPEEEQDLKETQRKLDIINDYLFHVEGFFLTLTPEFREIAHAYYGDSKFVESQLDLAYDLDPEAFPHVRTARSLREWVWMIEADAVHYFGVYYDRARRDFKGYENYRTHGKAILKRQKRWDREDRKRRRPPRVTKQQKTPCAHGREGK